ncbi:uncharacterized protein LOC135169787 [Diachasmimorpha longicaudata]|uniref:uncharacterized protein LOC135169787 n=1 Tax=Diachasmimorpha longicaudata TaxID=58733 RepID=UPI0030B8F8A5
MIVLENQFFWETTCLLSRWIVDKILLKELCLTHSTFQLVEITGCTVRDVQFQFDRDLKGVIVPQELHVQDFSTVTSLGKFDVANSVQQKSRFKEITIEKCLYYMKVPIAVSGYIRNNFVVFKTVGQVALANGNIADGHFRLCVQIRGFQDSPSLEKGVFATFFGEIDSSKPRLPFLEVDGMSSVVVDETIEKMSSVKLRLSFHLPLTPNPVNAPNTKRPVEDDKENSCGDCVARTPHQLDGKSPNQV